MAETMGATTIRIKTLSIMTLRKMAHSIMAFVILTLSMKIRSIKTFSITTGSIMTLCITIKNEALNAFCNFAIMLNVVRRVVMAPLRECVAKKMTSN
jgi:hypothetical protein